jgi:hypothetical protein
MSMPSATKGGPKEGPVFTAEALDSNVASPKGGRLARTFAVLFLATGVLVAFLVVWWRLLRPRDRIIHTRVATEALEDGADVEDGMGSESSDEEEVQQSEVAKARHRADDAGHSASPHSTKPSGGGATFSGSQRKGRRRGNANLFCVPSGVDDEQSVRLVDSVLENSPTEYDRPAAERTVAQTIADGNGAMERAAERAAAERAAAERVAAERAAVERAAVERAAAERAAAERAAAERAATERAAAERAASKKAAAHHITTKEAAAQAERVAAERAFASSRPGRHGQVGTDGRMKRAPLQMYDD